MATIDYQTRLEQTQKRITDIDAAITIILEGGHQSYTLDTTQSVQKMLRLPLETLQDMLENNLSMEKLYCKAISPKPTSMRST